MKWTARGKDAEQREQGNAIFKYIFITAHDFISYVAFLFQDWQGTTISRQSCAKGNKPIHWQ
ncbi:MAG: hypothetical protein PVS3B1_02870 [Ktedonobacteraceae bacterium]